MTRSDTDQYVFHTHGACETLEQSAEVFMNHASFLLRCMIEEDDAGDVEWTKTNVFMHLRRHKKVREMMHRTPVLL